MRFAVIGASGFVGQRVVEELRTCGHRVTAVARSPRPGLDHTLDATEATTERFRVLVAGHDGVVFAAGLDDREVRRKPAYPALHQSNVTSVERLMGAAREEGLTRAVIVGSYYTHFHRQHPQWHLDVHHPYVRSRIEQARAARAAAGPDLPVAVLELPFVFGRSGDRLPNWSPPLDRWIRSRSPLLAPEGGSAVTTVDRVAETAVAALESASSEDLPVVDENLTWTQLFDRIATAAGHSRRVNRLPSFVLRAALSLTRVQHTLADREAGLNPAHLADLLLRELFIATPTGRSIEDAIAQTFPRGPGEREGSGQR
jgi:nucleoside-diphosphate-sugar epimerase